MHEGDFVALGPGHKEEGALDHLLDTVLRKVPAAAQLVRLIFNQ